MELGKNGMVRIDNARATGLPIFDYRVTNSPGHHSDLCDDDDFKRGAIELTEYERTECIRGFVIYQGWRGCKPLYSLKEILERRS